MPDPEVHSEKLKGHGSRTSAIINLVVPLIPTAPKTTSTSSKSRQGPAEEPSDLRGVESESLFPNSPTVKEEVKEEEESEEDADVKAPELDPFLEDCNPTGVSEEPPEPPGAEGRRKPRKTKPFSRPECGDHQGQDPVTFCGDDDEGDAQDGVKTNRKTLSEDRPRKIRLSSSSAEAIAGKMEITTYKDPTTGLFRCPFPSCSRLFKATKHIPPHYEADHLHIRYQCEKCELEFTFQSAYYRHYKQVHIGVKKYKCSSCDKRFPRRKNLEVHNPQRCRERMELAQAKPPGPGEAKLPARPQPQSIKYRCSRCPEVFNTPADRREHVKEAHPISKEGEVCDLCGKQLASSFLLWRHKATVHSKVRKYICDRCGMKFKRNDNLVDHRNAVHFGIRKPRAPRQRKKDSGAASISIGSEGVSQDQE